MRVPENSAGGAEGNSTGDPPQLLKKINNNTKWVVSLLAFTALLARHDEFMAWCIIGAVANGALAKILKRWLNQDRPETALGSKKDPGMPSSHAQSILFLSTYSVYAVFESLGFSVVGLSMTAFIIIIAVFLTWLRVATGLHTIPQVVVGGAIGSFSGYWWIQIWKSHVFPALSQQQSTPFLSCNIYISCIIATLIFSSQALFKWAKENS